MTSEAPEISQTVTTSVPSQMESVRTKRRGRPSGSKNKKVEYKLTPEKTAGEPCAPSEAFEECGPSSHVMESVYPKIEPVKIKQPSISKESQKFEVVETIDFFDSDGRSGRNNKLSIQLSKGNNRTWKVQLFLNDKIQIAPATYTGATGQGFWDMLKGILKR